MHGVYLCQDLRANSQVYKLHIYWKGGMAKNWYFYIFLTKFCLFLHTISCILSYLQILKVIGHNIPMSWVKNWYTVKNIYLQANLSTVEGIFLLSWETYETLVMKKICILFGSCAKYVTNIVFFIFAVNNFLLDMQPCSREFCPSPPPPPKKNK